MKKVLILILVGFFLLASRTTTNASVTCQPIYGGGQTCTSSGNIQISKTVQNPQTGAFVTSLGINDPKFSPGQTVPFQVTISNTGGSNISQVTVSDIMPQFLNFVSGPGNFTANNQTLTFTVSNLAAGASQTFNVIGQVVGANQLPTNQGVVCVVNQAQVSTSDNQTSQANAQLCIQQQTPQVQPAPTIKQTPPTGPEMLPLLGLIPTGLLGFLLRKKAKGGDSK
jgi:uncharacterized repeat protein (TIGR01451 family)